MRYLQNHEVLLNLALFKRYHFYQLFNPNGRKFFNYNIYTFINVVFIAIMLCLYVFSAMGFLTEAISKLNYIDLLLIMFIYIVFMISVLKIWVFLVKADKIWDLFYVTRFDFFKSKRCLKNIQILYRYRDKSIQITNLFQYFCTMVLITWMVIPLVLNTSATPENPNQRYENIFNMPYPVTTKIYNQYFYIFYMIEVAVGIFIYYYSIIIDNFLISLCWAIIAQYEVITTTFENLGHEETLNDFENEDKENDCTETYDDLKSILFDQLNVNVTLNSFFSVVWIIVVALIAINSGAIIILSYSFIVVCLSTETYSVFSIIKLFAGLLNFSIQLFLYCYLFAVLNDKKESVNFGMYSCNWTMMDIKCQKLLLFAMKFNNANKLKMKATPYKIVNIQLFSSVINTSFNTVTVMLKTLNARNNVSE